MKSSKVSKTRRIRYQTIFLFIPSITRMKIKLIFWLMSRHVLHWLWEMLRTPMAQSCIASWLRKESQKRIQNFRFIYFPKAEVKIVFVVYFCWPTTFALAHSHRFRQINRCLDIVPSKSRVFACKGKRHKRNKNIDNYLRVRIQAILSCAIVWCHVHSRALADWFNGDSSGVWWSVLFAQNRTE